MLFDLQSPRRRRFIKVIYGSLAVLMGGGLIFFGIGGEVSGGLVDGLGLGDDGGGDVSFDEDVEAAEKKLAVNPKDQAALLALARARVNSGNLKLEPNPETQIPTPTEESQQEYQQAVSAWDRYLKTKPPQPDVQVATLMSQAYVYLAESSTSASDALANIKGAADSQQLVADAQPSAGSLSELATYLYFAGDTAAADAAAKEAEEMAEPSQRSTVKEQMSAFKKAGAEFQKQVEEANKAAGAGAPGANPLEDTGGGLSGGGLGGGVSLGGP